MLLRGTTSSPFVRKVRIAAHHLNLDSQMSLVTVDAANAVESIGPDNPLRKIPVLRLDNGRRLYDSRVILEYLDHLAGGDRLLPKDWDKRLDALTGQALGDGILDAGVLIVYEGRHRPKEIHHEPWLAYQRGKVERGLEAFAADPPDPTTLTVGTLALACALGYLDFRKQVDWRTAQPTLVAWLDRFRAAVPAFDQTTPEG
ncbi:MAG TPA: glutathione S-transferase family protein [Beijerinckiaceae bacterium]|jgi:glutathione S-transferase|nr:glutathione S-transferase family protein [Beijerinckiaceae bacterium]